MFQITGKVYTFGIAVLLCTALVFLGCEDSGGSSSSAPAVPANFAAQAGIGNVVLTWTVSEGTSVTGYKIRQTVSGTTTDIDVAGRETASYTVTGLTNDTSYSFTIAAVAGSTESAQSEPVTATPVFTVPAGLTAAAGHTQVVLSWTASALTGVTGYKIRQTVSGTTTDIAVSGRETASHTVTGLTNGTSYSFTIAAVAGSIESAQSTAVTETPVGMSHVASVADDSSTAVDRSKAVNAFTYNNTRYIVTGSDVGEFNSGEKGLSVFSFDGSALTHTTTLMASHANALYNIWGIQTFEHNSTTYIAAGIQRNTYLSSGGTIIDGDGVVSVFSFDGSALTRVTTIKDSDNESVYAIEFVLSITVFTHGGKTYLAAIGDEDNGFSVFSFDGSALTHVAAAKDSDSDAYALLGPFAIHSFVHGGTTYLAVSATDDNRNEELRDHGFSVFSFDGTNLTHTGSVKNQLWSSWEINSFVHGGNTYLAATESTRGRSGLSIFSFDGSSSINLVTRVLESENPSFYALDGVYTVTTFEYRGNTYLVTGSGRDDGVTLFKFDGSRLHHIQTIVDSDNAVYELDWIYALTSFVDNNNIYIAVMGNYDKGMSVFKVE